MPVRRTVPLGPEAPGREDAGPAFLGRAEVRDVLAWVRLLADPQDASAVVRALARPPIELRQVDLARVIQVARRRKLDLVVGLLAATESPRVPPEARERIQRFVELHRACAAELDALPPDVFLGRLIERLATPGRPLLGPEAAAEQSASLERLHELAIDFVQANPRAGYRELVRHLAAMAPPATGPVGAPIGQEPAATPGGPEPADRSRGHDDAGGRGSGDRLSDTDVPPGGIDQLASPPVSAVAHAEAERLQAAYGALREEVLEAVARIGGRLGELRLDTEVDISHGVVRYLELLKLSALLQRPEGQSAVEALADINARLLAATTPLQREILETSPLDQALVGAPGERRRAVAWREDSLEPFLPRRGVGLALSASDIHVYRSCPLRYKYARVLRIPTEQTRHQRFGIVVHQVLERYHSDGASSLAQMLELLDSGWRRSGLGDGEPERELREKAGAALTRYHARLQDERSEPVWFERQFSFRIGPHHLRGRVDRVDRLADGESERYELIDYKTSRPKSPEELRDDIQLSLYALAAREDWDAGVLAPGLLLRARRREGAGDRERGGARLRARGGARGGGGDPRPGLRRHALGGGVLDVRLPHRLPGGRHLDD